MKNESWLVEAADAADAGALYITVPCQWRCGSFASLNAADWAGGRKWSYTCAACGAVDFPRLRFAVRRIAFAVRGAVRGAVRAVRAVRGAVRAVRGAVGAVVRECRIGGTIDTAYVRMLAPVSWFADAVEAAVDELARVLTQWQRERRSAADFAAERRDLLDRQDRYNARRAHTAGAARRAQD